MKTTLKILAILGTGSAIGAALGYATKEFYGNEENYAKRAEYVKSKARNGEYAFCWYSTRDSKAGCRFYNGKDDTDTANELNTQAEGYAAPFGEAAAEEMAKYSYPFCMLAGLTTSVWLGNKYYQKTISDQQAHQRLLDELELEMGNDVRNYSP